MKTILEHFQEKACPRLDRGWNPVFRPKMRQCKNAGAVSLEAAPARRRRGRSQVAGFTLIETLIATALMVAIISALATVTAQWLPNWNRGFARVQRTELASLGLERIVADLTAAEFILPYGDAKAPLFDGAELSVTFVRSALGPNTRPGLEIVRISETADQRGLAMVRASAPFLPLAPDGSGAQPRFGDPVVLVRAPYRVSFSYAGDDRAWHSAWRNTAMLPTAVRVLLRDAATAQTLAISTAATVHVNLSARCVSAQNVTDCALGKAEAENKAADREPGERGRDRQR
jgi:general secretion pathway protein J